MKKRNVKIQGGCPPKKKTGTFWFVHLNFVSIHQFYYKKCVADSTSAIKLKIDVTSVEGNNWTPQPNFFGNKSG